MNSIHTIVRYKIILLCTFILISSVCYAQNKRKISLSYIIEAVKENSNSAKEAEVTYRKAKLNYEIYKYSYKPLLKLALRPINYNRNIIQRYLPESNQDIYRPQQTLFSYGKAIIEQKIGFTGGDLFLYSDISAYRSFGPNNTRQFTTVPIGLGYTQKLLGYNSYKWERKIENLRVKLITPQLAYELEGISSRACKLFYNILTIQKQLDLGKENINICDTILNHSILLEKLGRLTKSNLLQLKVEKLKAEQQVITLENKLSIAKMELFSFVKFPMDEDIDFEIPNSPKAITLSVDDVIGYSLENSQLIQKQCLEIVLAQQKIDKARKERYADMSLDLSIGLNQTSENLSKSYQSPLRQDVISVGITIPLIDWGIRKKNLKYAEELLHEAILKKEDIDAKIRREAHFLYRDYNLHLQTLKLIQENRKLAHTLQKESKERFIIGKENLETVLKANQHVEEIELDHIKALGDCWNDYYLLRQYMLYDWERNIKIDLECVQQE